MTTPYVRYLLRLHLAPLVTAIMVAATLPCAASSMDDLRSAGISVISFYTCVAEWNINVSSKFGVDKIGVYDLGDMLINEVLHRTDSYEVRYWVSPSKDNDPNNSPCGGYYIESGTDINSRISASIHDVAIKENEVSFQDAARTASEALYDRDATNMAKARKQWAAAADAYASTVLKYAKEHSQSSIDANRLATTSMPTYVSPADYLKKIQHADDKWDLPFMLTNSLKEIDEFSRSISFNDHSR